MEEEWPAVPDERPAADEPSPEVALLLFPPDKPSRSPPEVRVVPTPPWPVGWLEARLSDPSLSDSDTPCLPDEPVPLPRPPRPPDVVELEPSPVPVPVPLVAEDRPEGAPDAVMPVPVVEP